MQIERHDYDVIVIGAGGAGLRAAIETRSRGLRTAVVCKSLFGKAHTVMAEGGIAASMGNANSRDDWQVHFRDTMRGGKFLNNWRMAELHAKEAPQRVWELETYGALFDRTADGRISQRNFGGHEYPRLAHVGDRTGLELIRTLQQKVVSLQQEDHAAHGDYEAGLRVFQECTVTELLKDAPDGRIAGAFAYQRETGRYVLFRAPAVILATGGIGKSFKVTSNSWEYTGDGHALALRAGASLINMEFVQFHPTGMVWPPSVKGILVTESVRGDGGVLRNSAGERFMFGYIPEVFKDNYADSEAEADRWYTDPDGNRRPPELLPRDEVARAINSEIKAGRGSPHGGVYLDIASRMSPEEITRRLPSMHHQFRELADVDITSNRAWSVRPSLSPRVKASHAPIVVIANNMLLQHFAAWPAPLSPQWTTFLPIASNNGWAASKFSWGPPTMNVSVPFSAPAVPPETGASRARCPASCTRSAASRASSTLIVEQSMNRVFSGAAESKQSLFSPR